MKVLKQLQKEAKIIQEKLELKKKAKAQKQRFVEMSMHCKQEDGYGIIVAVASSIESNKSKGSKKEHNPPHAHFWVAKNRNLYGRFQIVDKNPPQSVLDLKKVDDSDMDFGKYGKTIVEWVNQEPVRAMHKGNKTNWDAMRDAWRDIQDEINLGLKYPEYI